MVPVWSCLDWRLSQTREHSLSSIQIVPTLASLTMWQFTLIIFTKRFSWDASIFLFRYGYFKGDNYLFHCSNGDRLVDSTLYFTCGIQFIIPLSDPLSYIPYGGRPNHFHFHSDLFPRREILHRCVGVFIFTRITLQRSESCGDTANLAHLFLAMDSILIVIPKMILYRLHIQRMKRRIYIVMGNVIDAIFHIGEVIG